MTRRFIDNIRTEISTLLADNSTGDISATDLQGILDDMCDSLITDEAAITGDVEQDLIVDATFQPVANFSVSIGGDTTYLKLNPTAGTITTATQAGFSYDITGRVAFIASNNEQYEFSILENGLPVGFIGLETGTGNGDLQSITVSGTKISAVSDAVFQLGIASLSGAADITIVNYVLRADINPTNDP